MIKYESLTLKIYIRNMKHYTDIDPTVDFVFPVNKIDREKGEKTNLKLTKCVFRSCNLRTKYVFTSKDHCNVHHFFYRSIASVVASCNTNNFFSVPRFSIRRKKNPQKLNVFFLDQNRRNDRLYGNCILSHVNIKVKNYKSLISIGYCYLTALSTII
jgi:hypothetical protein